jgi:hypothetical protein
LRNRAALWNEVERGEKRKDARLAREIRVSLPQELTREQNIELAREIAREFVKSGMIADLCIHDHTGANPHAHMMLTTRAVDEDGFGQKVRAWDRRENVEQWRGMVADRTNDALERYNHPDRVDHRSYERQGKDRIPLNRLSRAAWEMEQRGIQTAEGDRRRAIQAENRRLEALATERQQVTRDMDAEQKRLAQESDGRRQREEATRRQRERQQIRKRAGGEPPRRFADLYDRPETLTQRAERDGEKQQERNRRKLHGDPPTVRRAGRQPRQYRKPETSQPTPESPRRFSDLYDRPAPEQGRGEPTTHAPESCRAGRFSDLYDLPPPKPEQPEKPPKTEPEHTPEPTPERQFSDLYDHCEKEQDKPERKR